MTVKFENHFVIGIVGRISSGKSTLAKRICNHYQAKTLSFGKYLFDYSQAQGLPTEREDLQALGEQFIANDPSLFFQNVLNSQTNLPQIIVIEGIRHKAIFNEIKTRFTNAVFAFIDVPIDIRYKWYIERIKAGDSKISFEKFVEIDSHPVECEINDIKVSCDLIFGQDLPDKILFDSLDQRLVR
ncbi:MAG TPA: hypothetical protein VHA56_22075 [Mucilaginibacter sp.]|nr:hypothetical protein [Mucilaginibacter sp.]